MKQCDIDLIEEKPLKEDMCYPYKMGIIKRWMFRKDCRDILRDWDCFLNEEKFKYKIFYFSDFFRRKGKTKWI